MSVIAILRHLRFARAYEHKRNVVAIHPIDHNLCVRSPIAISYERRHGCYPQRNRRLGTADRILRIRRQNVAPMVPCGGEAESAPMEKWPYNHRLWSEHSLLNADRRTGYTRAHHRWVPVLFLSVDARFSHWILDRPERSGCCVDRNGPT